ncbi:hypothetical protein A3I27_03470 [Candidatus Giovannonibacteria bacterium RIFCSPLOWO2_02_FULL_43_11b]|uniref:Uncharacterized protein n=1 Tax=Candidatus Taylorbacteria bacterium RIFCSPHIGHO2_02_FULL_45_35 TaxID=1802311 RepID=A0A1G2MU48_9BACT|nr:MAG: hypothetical protein A3I27_03470 [Candidatus Giovannonibacteria bacterium RIFCSPLOWO2_02_FULL_43_11b]OHA19835.1 MAG: hypothetical protein A2836_01650 [Candidatus Taylorbacteria bacterium RIFCSPHIGHO2_01_FULL_45_63]OHA27428.1 MAG: hypothetical protein A3D56_02995 [Candidatus Taylorbacteria bacterium RIFCSPHIGHO2_02_FULL_45_35]OHA34215.1 MAG: hypothetical protein A3A22_01515 [Candidatus Taylorbacteria bacterium RIFCSPLOWO2_01_FULL_45_34b]
MSNVQFEDENKVYAGTRPLSRSRESFLTKFVLRVGLAKDDRGVRNVFFGIIILAVVLSVIFLWKSFAPQTGGFVTTPDSKSTPPPAFLRFHQ